MLTRPSAEAGKEGSADWRRVVSVAFDLTGSNAVVRPGDSIAVLARNDSSLVTRLLSRLGLDADEVVRVDGARGASRPAHVPPVVAVRDLFERHLDISSPLRKTALAGLAECSEGSDKATLQYLASRSGKDYYKLQVR